MACDDAWVIRHFGGANSWTSDADSGRVAQAEGRHRREGTFLGPAVDSGSRNYMARNFSGGASSRDSIMRRISTSSIRGLASTKMTVEPMR